MRVDMRNGGVEQAPLQGGAVEDVFALCTAVLVGAFVGDGGGGARLEKTLPVEGGVRVLVLDDLVLGVEGDFGHRGPLSARCVRTTAAGAPLGRRERNSTGTGKFDDCTAF